MNSLSPIHSYFKSRSATRLVCFLAIAFLFTPRASAQTLVLPDNLKVLKADAPNTDYRFAGSNAPAQMFLPGEKVTVNFSFIKGSDTGTSHDYSIELQEITTRNPDLIAHGGFSITGMDNTPLIGLEGAPIQVPLTIAFTDQPRTEFKVDDFPLPARFGTYAMILEHGAKRQFLGTIARLPQPRADGTVENTPLFGEGALDCVNHPGYYSRMGVHGWRNEASWNENEDGTIDWSQYDKLFAMAKKDGSQMMITLEGCPPWSRPFNDPTPAAGWTPASGFMNGSADWLCKPDLYPRYGKWIEAFVRRYWENGKGGLWGIENYNEPWDGGGISGWASDIPRYRELQKLIATSVKNVDPRIRILGACSIMNTEDKLYSDGTTDMDKYIDIFTDHYVMPANCYGPEVAKAHRKQSMDTEAWFVNSEFSLPQGAVGFLACGQNRLSPWHPSMLFDTVPGAPDQYFIPTPLTVATAAFNQMATGRPFEKMLFQEHLPFAFQFGKDSDKDSLVILFGRLMPIGTTSFRANIWQQINSEAGGTITIDNHDGLLDFFDLAGNPEFQGEKSVTLPLSFLPTYIKSPQGASAVAQRLNEAKIVGKRFVEIIPHDFTSLPNANGAVLRVELRNRLNRAVTGSLAVMPSADLTLATTSQSTTINPGESKILEFPISQAQLSVSNSYPCKFAFTSPDGNASYAETLNAAIVPKKTIKVDGNLDEWADVAGVNVIGTTQDVDAAEQARKPWLEIQKNNPTATSGELKMAWDDNYLYICARVNDPTPEKYAFRFSERDENSYFHSAADDNISPYKEFIEAYRQKTNNPKRSFAEVPYVYRKSPEDGSPPVRDRLQFAFDTSPGNHGLEPATLVPPEFHSIPDTDYEYSLYWVNDQKNGSGELWRLLAPGVPRISDYPHEPKGERTTGAVTGAIVAVKHDGATYIYEAAIPRAELSELKLQAGSQFGFAFQIGNSEGGNAIYGQDKAITKDNGLTLHPYYKSTPNADTRWTLAP